MGTLETPLALGPGGLPRYDAIFSRPEENKPVPIAVVHVYFSILQAVAVAGACARACFSEGVLH